MLTEQKYLQNGDCILDKPKAKAWFVLKKLEFTSISILSAPYTHDEAQAFTHVEAMLWGDAQICAHCGVVDSAYPYCERVSDFVCSKMGGFLVHDGSGAMNYSWHNGLDKGGLARTFRKSAVAFGCEYSRSGNHLFVQSEDWLFEVPLVF